MCLFSAGVSLKTAPAFQGESDESFALSLKVFQALESRQRDETSLRRGSEPLQDKGSCKLKPLKTA